jgi:Type I restriction enzyme R protein N terminus (HSDR_N)
MVHESVTYWSSDDGMKRTASLADSFTRGSQRYTARGYLEDTCCTEFIGPLLKALGWDVDNERGASLDHLDVIRQYPIEIGGKTHWADYSLGIAQDRFCIVEAKAPSVRLGKGAAYQARRYGFHSGHRVAVLTNFRELKVFDCEVKPLRSDPPSTSLLLQCDYGEYVEQWANIWKLLSQQAVLSGEAPSMLRELQEWPDSPSRIGQQRRLALARIVAGEASREPDVIGFRAEVLDGHLLSLDEIPDWLEDRAAADGGATVWWRFPLPHGGRGYDWREPFGEWLMTTAGYMNDLGRTFTPAGWSIELLEFLVPDSHWVHSMPIANDGTLARLKHLAGDLVSAFPVWREASAVTFCLSGKIPAIPPATVGTSAAWRYPALGRATLELDPSMSHKEVARLYDKARQMGDRVFPKMPSRMEVELALMTGDVDLASGMHDELLGRMADWNANHPKMPYDSVETFAKAAEVARAAVLGMPAD